ncbi:MAG TPA: cupin domain-containing protein [Gemmatimonadales bacterium]|nr:cupin domain-containing protein [Gemmatimonadales bacterium]
MNYMMRPSGMARFDAARGTKTDLARGERLFLGLNCFEPGQAQSAHTHADADKFYLLLEGKARMRIGDQVITAEAGDLVTVGAPETSRRAQNASRPRAADDLPAAMAATRSPTTKVTDAGVSSRDGITERRPTASARTNTGVRTPTTLWPVNSSHR